MSGIGIAGLWLFLAVVVVVSIVVAAGSVWLAAFLGQLTALTSARNSRVLDALPKIPGLLWAGLLFGGVLLVALTGFVRLESKVGHVVLSSSVAVLLGLLLFIVFWLDHPFGTQLGVTSAPFERALSVFDAVDRGT
jgi:hypothetical protein